MWLYVFITFVCRPPVIRVHDKVMIPQDEHPDINFVGLLIGPRGNTLKGTPLTTTVRSRPHVSFRTS